MKNSLKIDWGGICLEKTIDIAHELLHNTEGIQLRDLIQSYITISDQCKIGQYKDEEMLRFHNIVCYIQDTEFNIKGWSLIEIPIFFTFCFGHIKNNKFFDLDVYEIGKVIPKYVDEYDNEKEVESIQEAIKKYDLLQTHVADCRNS